MLVRHPNEGESVNVPADDKVKVIFSMDCLPADCPEGFRGAESWDSALREPVAFARALHELGFSGTFFIPPESLGRMQRTVDALIALGAELGMLCHPQLSGYPGWLGSYSFDRQSEIVGLGVATWQNAMGEHPDSFRPGFFSANDHTYHVLCMQGFHQGSCSLPGRQDNEQCSMWRRAYPYPHHTDPMDRLAKGSMEFYEVPVTSGFDAEPVLGTEMFTPPHLRVEDAGIHDYLPKLVDAHLDGQAEAQVKPRVVHLITSSLVQWGAPEDPHVERLQNLCESLAEVAAKRGLKLDPATLSSVHEEADSHLPPRFED